jgi:hypothetical protein
VDLSPWSAWIDGRVLVKDLRPELREHCFGQPIEECWTSRGHFGEATVDDADWDAACQARKSMNKGQ